MNNPEEDRRKILKYAFLAACGVLLIFILWSVATETLIPLYNSKKFDELIYNIIGIPLILLGTGIFVYGGWVFVWDTSKLFGNNPQIGINLDIIRDKTKPKEEIIKARSENSKLLFSTWKKGALRLLIGALFIIAGGIIINM